jgi:hypothetical protein
MIASSARYSVSDDVLSRELEGEMVLLHAASGTYFSLNDTGTIAWHLLSSGATLDEARDALVKQLDVPPETATRDVGALVARLLEADLIRLRADA